MALKENIQAIKQEIGAEEQFLESIIKGERLFKKYKLYIIAGLIVIIGGGIGLTVNKKIKNDNLLASNNAYDILLKNPTDTKALSILQKTNKALHETYLFVQASQKRDVKQLEQIANSQTDPILKDIANFQLGKNSSFSSLQSLLDGYKLLKENKISDAKLAFANIPLTDNILQQISKSLSHYQGIKK